ncbi:unnamed protein product [Meganyctiphanes norvegica]|uniref:Uncharacterized protein n=1 Tax=Meganyctiphanes norvegica TaxID=48144 RepID=A0AAV2R9E8_MEGNR
MADQCFCLRWNNFQSSVVGVLRSLLEEGQFVDVTLACDGRRLKAHKLMLSACSNLFRDLLKENPSDHPIIFLRDVRFWELESIMDFIYNGQVNVMQDQLPGFIRTAEALQIKGLAAVNNNNIHSKHPDSRPFVPDLGNSSEMFVSRGGDPPEAHYPHAAKRPRRPPLPGHTPHPPRSDIPLSGVPGEDVKPHVPGDPQIEPSRTESRATDLSSLGLLHGSSPNVGSHDGRDRSSNGETDEHSNSTPEGESDSEFMGDANIKDMEWIPGDGNSPLAVSYNECGLPICKICGKVFKHQGSLVAHYQVHQLRTKCPVCKKVLSRHYHMKVHLLTVHKVPDAEIEGLLRSQNIV